VSHPAFDRLRASLPEQVALAARPVAQGGEILAIEAEAMAKALPARRQEFAAGRAAARAALGDAGAHAGAAILMAEDRSPTWPAGFLGSISHGGGWAAALAVPARDALAVGLDVEVAEDLPPEVAETIILPGDRAGALSGHLGPRLIFSAKECVYKALYPLHREVWEFGAVTGDLNAEAGRFHARLNQPAGPLLAGTEVRGQVVLHAGLIVCALLLPDH